MTDREVIVPLKEPVSIEKALLGGHQVQVSTSIEGSSAAFLVNIQLTGWNNTKEYNEGYARGFNNAAEWMQKAIASHAASIEQAARATAEQPDPTPEPFGYVYRIISELRPHDPMYRFAKTGELNPDPEVVRSWTKHAVYITPQAPQSRDSVIEACAKEADKLSVKYWDDYKRGKGQERANPYFEGKSDGAEEAADAIRALKSQQDAAIESQRSGDGS